MADEAKKDNPADGHGGKKKNPLLLVVIILLVLVLAGGAGVGYMVLFKGGGGEAKDGHKPAAEHGQAAAAAKSGAAVSDREMLGTTYRMDPFIVNLNENDSTRYLKVVMEAEVTSETVSAEIERRLPQIRDLCLTTLSAKAFSDIQGADGKFRLKEELMFAMNKVLASGQVKRIYFTQFVVQ